MFFGGQKRGRLRATPLIFRSPFPPMPLDQGRRRPEDGKRYVENARRWAVQAEEPLLAESEAFTVNGETNNECGDEPE